MFESHFVDGTEAFDVPTDQRANANFITVAPLGEDLLLDAKSRKQKDCGQWKSFKILQATCAQHGKHDGTRCVSKSKTSLGHDLAK